MPTNELGQLVPVGGGDAIPLVREQMTLGRRESCDICLQFANVSGLHCELTYKTGYWMITDLGSTNGIKVNGVRVNKRSLIPGDEISIGKRAFRIEYTPPAGMATLDEVAEEEEDTLGLSLLEKAGLMRPSSLPQLVRPSSKDPKPKPAPKRPPTDRG